MKKMFQNYMRYIRRAHRALIGGNKNSFGLYIRKARHYRNIMLKRGATHYDLDWMIYNKIRHMGEKYCEDFFEKTGFDRSVLEPLLFTYDIK